MDHKYDERRRELLIQDLNLRSAKSLEFGPLHRPLLEKNQTNVFYVDHASRAELMETYKNEPAVDVQKIVEVDYVLDQCPLVELVAGRSFDFILASHVGEHIPNLIGWLQDLSSLLAPGGRISLALPDKRRTFDLHRALTLPAALLEAYYQKYQKPSPGQIYSYMGNETAVNTDPGRNPFQRRPGPPSRSPEEALKIADYSHFSGKYINIHCWVWTDESFLLLMKSLMLLGLTDLKLAAYHPTPRGRYEFFVQLTRCQADPSNREARLQEQLQSLPRRIRSLGVTEQAFLSLDRTSIVESGLLFGLQLSRWTRSKLGRVLKIGLRIRAS